MPSKSENIEDNPEEDERDIVVSSKMSPNKKLGVFS